MDHLGADPTFPAQAESLQDRLYCIDDSPQPCPYLDDTIAKMPLFLPRDFLRGSDVDRLLEGGFRRSGRLVYYTRCAPCFACEAVRLDVTRFHWSRSYRRILKRAEADLTLTWQPPLLDEERVRLYNEHRRTRDLGSGEPTSVNDYRAFLVDTCVPTIEMEIRKDDELVGISIMDVGETSVSAVYTHFSPSVSRNSPGTLAVLQQIQWALDHGKRWVYLGLYVAANSHLNYKARFRPQQRLVRGVWQEMNQTQD